MDTRKEILVVEDNAINRMTLKHILGAEYDVLEAANGEEALSVLEKRGEHLSLILLDIVMPVMDGYTFLAQIKVDPVYSLIPVIVATQSGDEADEVAALSHGATDFVAKPYKPQVILHRVASIINLRETAAMINQFQYDTLTGLYSKAFFYQKAYAILRAQPNQAFDIICCDMENFKLINDVFGTAAGDGLLCDVAGACRSLAGENGICGRFNADQFACLVPSRQEYTNDFFAALSGQVKGLSNLKNVVMKWGVYRIHNRELPVEKMCDRAVLAVRSVKGQYGKYFALYDDTLRAKLLREKAITDTMETALQEGQFEVYFQPEYSIKKDCLSGAEALVRWKHPEWGCLSPAQFVPLFEKNGFITRLDQFVWEQACACLHSWDEKHWPAISVSVNVSRADIYNVSLPDILHRLTEKYQIAPQRLHLEITESAYTEDPAQIVDTVEQLRQQGFIIEMDDFGSGYSSLNMLNDLPIDVLKLDMKFIQNETAKPVNQGILRFIISLARWMDLGVVAEGVETKEQLERLQEIGCDYVQGYYFARPMPRANFERLLSSGGVLTGRADRQASCLRPGRCLLVADEDQSYRTMLRQTFAGRYQLLEADDTASALKLLTENQGRITAVVLSATLPVDKQDGFTVLEVLQREKNVWHIPVVVTGPLDTTLEEQALEKGADDYAVRPHTPGVLWRRLQQVIGITASRERERLLQNEAYQDYLTGLLNRRGLQAAAEALGRDDAPIAVFVVDLDNLKEVNDRFGHAAGDKVIQRLCNVLRSHTRDSDLLVRYGGDEFVAVMKHMWLEENAQRKGDEICCALQEHPEAHKYPATCSVGVAFWNGESPLQTALDRADEALYTAKAASKGSCQIWKG